MASILSPSISLHLSRSPSPSKLGFLNPQPSRTLYISLRTHKPIKTLYNFPIRSQQNPPKLSLSNESPKPTIFWRNVSQKAAVFLIGSLLFLGRFSRKPVMAMIPDSPKTNISESSSVDEKENEIEDEVEKFSRILERNPEDAEALKVVLYGKMKKGRTAEAVKYIKKLIEVEPEEVEWQLLEALSYELMGQLGKAKRLFRDILKERPLLVRALHGIVYSLLDKKEEADEQFEIFRNLVPDEFPQRGFINDMIIAAKTETQEQLQKEFESESSYRK